MVEADIAQSSKDYYKNLSGLKQTEKDCIAILEVIRELQPICDKEISEILDRPINVVTGRRYELARKFKLIKEGVRKVYDYPIPVIHWVDINNLDYEKDIIGVDEL